MSFAPPTIELIAKTVATYYDLDVDEMFGARREREILTARRVCYLLARRLRGSSYPRLGRSFSVDHSTVIYSIRHLKSEIQTDERLAAQVSELEEMLS